MLRRTVRTLSVVAALTTVLLFILTGCPSNRDGMPGQLATAEEQTLAATRSGVLALDLWVRHRSSRQLAGVQLSDARDQIAKAYNDIAVLRAQDPADLDRQALLTDAMTSIIAPLNEANAAVRELPASRPVDQLKRSLTEMSDQLEREYH